MTTHRWTSSTRLKRHDSGDVIEPGETFEPTDSELRAFRDHIEVVEDAETDNGADADAAESGTDSEAPSFDEDAWFDDHDGFEDRVATVESGDVDAILDEIEAVEGSENVKDAIQDRRDELEE